MKKLIISLLVCCSLSMLNCENNNETTPQVIHKILTTLIEPPYEYNIKETVMLRDGGTLHHFNSKNATKPIKYDIKYSMEKTLPTHLAAMLGDVGDLKTLASWDANLLSKNMFDETPLFWAAKGGNFRAINYLIQNGAQINKSTRPFEDFNAFHYVMLLPKRTNIGTPTIIKTVQALLQADFNRTHLNQCSRIGTPLEIAVKEQLDPHIVTFLIRQGGIVTNTVKKGLKAKQYKPIAKALKKGLLHSQMYFIP